MADRFAVKVDAGIVEQVFVMSAAQTIPVGLIETSEHVGIGWEFDGTIFTAPVIAPPTPAELDAEVQAVVEERIGAGASDIDKAQFRVDADIWRAMNQGMTVQEARAAVRARYEFHIRAIRGL